MFYLATNGWPIFIIFYLLITFGHTLRLEDEIKLDFSNATDFNPLAIQNAEVKQNKQTLLVAINSDDPIVISSALSWENSKQDTYCIKFTHYYFEPKIRPLDVFAELTDGNELKLTSNHEYNNNLYTKLIFEVKSTYTQLIIRANMPWIQINSLEMIPGGCQKKWHCTFEIGEPCNWKILSTSPNYRFKTKKMDLDAGDVTTDSDGYVLATKKDETCNYFNVQNTTTFRSPQLQGGDNKHYCLTFYYFKILHTTDLLEIRPYFKNDNRNDSGTIVWSNEFFQSENVVNEWFKIQIPLFAKSDFQIDFVAHNMGLGGIILDEIKVDPHKCSFPPTCDFTKNNFCSYKSSESSDFRFLILNEIKSSKPHVTELEEHIKKLNENVDKAVAFVDFGISADAEKQTIDNSNEAYAELISGPFSFGKESCLKVQYSYIAEKEEQGTFSIGLTNNYESYTLLEDSQPQQLDGHWKEVEFTLPPGTSMSVEFKAEANDLHDSPVFAIKEVEFLKTPCQSSLESDNVPEFTCSFDVDICNYLANNPTLYFNRYTSKLNANKELIQFDANGNKNGGYMYVYINDILTREQNHVLNSSIFKPDERTQSNTYCLSFAYIIDCPEGACQLSVSRNNKKTNEYGQKKINDWNYVMSTFSHLGDFRMQFTAHFDNYSKGFVAIDEITVRTGNCHFDSENMDGKVCDFEHNHCGWLGIQKHHEPSFQIKRAKYLQPPTFDHSIGTGNGYVAALELNSKRKLNSPALFVNLAKINTLEGVCVSFWVNMNVEDLTIRLKTVTEYLRTKEKEWWTLLPQPRADTWLPFLVEIPSLVFENASLKFTVNNQNKDKSQNGFLALDDIKVQTGSCNFACTSDDFTCEWHDPHRTQFKYINDQNQEILKKNIFSRWLWSNHKRHPLDIDINLDEATANSNYLRLVSSKESESNKTELTYGLLSSSIHVLEENGSVCLLFDYLIIDPVFELNILFTGHVAETAALVHTIKSQNVRQKEWNKFQFQFNASDLKTKFNWNYVPKQLLSYLLVSQAESENNQSYNQNVVLNNLELLNGPCPASEQMFVCGDNVRIPAEKKCDFIYDCVDKTDEMNCGECADFKNGDCGYQFENKDNVKWFLNEQNIQTTKSKHIFGELNLKAGFYEAFLNSSHQIKAYSPLLKNTYTNCELTIEYVAINVRFHVNIISNKTKYTIYENSDSKNSHFESVQLSIGHHQESFNIVFDIHGPIQDQYKSIEGGILIKKMQLTNCFAPPAAFCTEQQFKCDNGACIDHSKVCDLNYDCADKSDEKHCYRRDINQMCDFENGQCEFVLPSLFQRTSSFFKFADGITYDHTTNSNLGKMLVAKSNQNQTAEILFPTMVDTGNCEIRWFANSRNVKSVDLYYYKDDEFEMQKHPLSVPSNLGWTRQSLMLNQINNFTFFLSMLSVTFELNREKGYFALDDFSLTDGCYPHRPDEMNCNFANNPDNGICAWHLSAFGTSVIGQFVKLNDNEKRHSLLGPEDDLGTKPYLLIRPIDFNEDGKISKHQIEQQEQLDDYWLNQNNHLLRSCDNCFELRSPLLNVDTFVSEYSLNIRYSLYGTEKTRLVIHLGDLSRPLFEDRDSSSNRFKERCILLKNNQISQFQIFINAEISDLNSYVILKQVSIQNHGCISKSADSECQFDEMSSCSSVSAFGSSDGMRSNLIQSPTGVQLVDHTRHSLSSGYIYSQYSTKNARHFFLREFTSSSVHCLTFWFTTGTWSNSNTQSLGRLLVKRFDDELNDDIVFESRANLYFDWQLVSIQIDQVQKYDDMFIEAQFDGKSDYLIALDDLLLKTGSCSKQIDCDFDDLDANIGMCGWYSPFSKVGDLSTYPPRWLHMYVNQLDNPTFPKSDYDKNNDTSQGFMLAYLEPTDKQAARLKSTMVPLSSSENSCLSFAYFSPAYSKLLLQIFIEQGILRKKVISFMPKEIIHNEWNLVKIDLNTTDMFEPTKYATKVWMSVVFEAVNMNLLKPTSPLPPIENFIALDDIQLFHQPCDQLNDNYKNYNEIELQYWMEQDLFETLDELQSSDTTSNSKVFIWWAIGVVAIAILIFAMVFKYKSRTSVASHLNLPRVSMVNILQHENPEF